MNLMEQASFAEIAQLVEHDLAKVGVASSSLVFRSRGHPEFRMAFFGEIPDLNSRPAPRGSCQRSRLRGNVEVAPPAARSKMVQESFFPCTNRLKSDDWYMREPSCVPIALKEMIGT